LSKSPTMAAESHWRLDRTWQRAMRPPRFGSSKSGSFAGAVHSGHFSVNLSKVAENTFRFAAVTDLDQLSCMKDKRKATYRSLLLLGAITDYPQSRNQYVQYGDRRKNWERQYNFVRAALGCMDSVRLSLCPVPEKDANTNTTTDDQAYVETLI
jgi:hypothetical protein